MISAVDDIIIRARFIVKTIPSYSKTRLAREAGMRINTFVDLDKDSFNPTANTLRALERVVHDVEKRLGGIGGPA